MGQSLYTRNLFNINLLPVLGLLLPSLLLADEIFLSNPDQYCPQIQVECVTNRKMSEICGGRACAFPNPGGEYPMCTMVIEQSICDFFGINASSKISGAEFRDKINCLNMTPEKLKSYDGSDAMLGCGIILHEYTHLSDPFAQSEQLGACTEKVAENKQNLLHRQMLAQLCSEDVTGDLEIHCNYLCGVLSNMMSYESWDGLMCNRMSDRIEHQKPVTSDDCLEIAKTCSSPSQWEQFAPTYCLNRKEKLGLQNQVSYVCESAPKSVHGCSTYGGPEISLPK